LHKAQSADEISLDENFSRQRHNHLYADQIINTDLNTVRNRIYRPHPPAAIGGHDTPLLPFNRPITRRLLRPPPGPPPPGQRPSRPPPPPRNAARRSAFGGLVPDANGANSVLKLNREMH
jgi:hypothetical protein